MLNGSIIDFIDMQLIIHGVLLVGIAGFSALLGCYCSLMALLGRFPIRGVALFWLGVTACVLVSIGNSWIGGAFAYCAGSPVLVSLLWYYDKYHSIEKHFSNVSTSNHA